MEDAEDEPEGVRMSRERLGEANLRSVRDTTSSISIETFGQSPLYVVLFSTVVGATDSNYPVVAAPLNDCSTITVPHAISQEMAAALPGLWYCIHLPGTLYELTDIPTTVMTANQALHLNHRILLSPIHLFDQNLIDEWLVQAVPTLVVCPDDLIEEAVQRSATLGFALAPAMYSELSNDSLRSHWRAIHSNFIPDIDYLGGEPKLTHRLDLAPTDLPMRFLLRQFGVSLDSQLVTDQNDLVREALWSQLVLAATSRLERKNITREVAEKILPQAIQAERGHLRIPVTLGLPGVAPAYSRVAYSSTIRKSIQPLVAVDVTDTWSIEMHQRSDPLVERSAIEFITTHQAVGRGGVGLILPTVPPKTFTILAQLEQHFAGRTHGPTVWRMLQRLNDAAQSVWSKALVEVIAHASMLTVFSNFPIGLLRMHGDTAPLSARVPIAYRPLIPLTRAVQIELQYVPPIDLTKRFRVLVVECIAPDDPVGSLSRSGWQFAAEIIRSEGLGVTIDLIETFSVDALRSAIDEKKPDFLVISAHGKMIGNTSGIMVGREFCLGPGLGPLPPVVILSACHVAPRGAGTVSVADLFLREGAVAVLGTQVPVNVFHNAMLMVRFFRYILEVLARREEHSTLLEIWHRVQTSNAINDVLNGNRWLHNWGYSEGASGVPVVQEFMDVRSIGQLRYTHIYEDTERVLLEIAADQGNDARVRNLLHSSGYVPESLFYIFSGRPERIHLRSLTEVFQDRMSRPGGENSMST